MISGTRGDGNKIGYYRKLSSDGLVIVQMEPGKSNLDVNCVMCLSIQIEDEMYDVPLPVLHQYNLSLETG